MVLNTTFNNIPFSYIAVVSVIGGGIRSTRKKNNVSSTPRHEQDSNSQH